MRVLRSLAFLIIFGFITGCQQQEPKPSIENAKALNEIQPPTQTKQKLTTKKSTKLTHTGTVKYFDFEGGFYGIVTNKGEKILPINLDKKYLKPDTIIKFSGRYKKDQVSIQQWGNIFKIEEVELIQLGKKDIDPTH